MKKLEKKESAPPAKFVLPLQWGQPTLARVEPQIHHHAERIIAGRVDYLHAILTFAVWWVWVASQVPRGEMDGLRLRVDQEHPGLPDRRERDLWVQLLLAAATEANLLSSRRRAYYRLHPEELRGLKQADLRAMAANYKSVRGMTRRLLKASAPQTDDEVFAAGVNRLYKLLSEHPDVQASADTAAKLQWMARVVDAPGPTPIEKFLVAANRPREVAPPKKREC